jgi:predicted nucleic acid-binding protein
MYLLDTNIISETIKSKPQMEVLNWLSSIDIHHVFLSVLTFGEIRKGVERLNDPVRKQKIIQWLEVDLVKRFRGRLIRIDEEVADKWGYISALGNVPAIDGLIAATALAHNFKLVTRNEKDFKGILGLEIINPWLSN